MSNISNKMTLWLTCALDIFARSHAAFSDLSIALRTRNGIGGVSAAFGIRFVPLTLVGYGRSVPIWRERPFDPLI